MPSRRPSAPSLDDMQFLSAVIETQSDIAGVELDVPTVMRIITQRTQSLTGADGAVIEMVEGDQIVYRSACGIAEPHVGLRLPVTASLSGLCARTGELQHCRDSESDPRVNSRACSKLGVRSMVVLPLLHEGQGIGVLKVMSSRPDAFDERSIAALRLMTNLLAAALGHASEFEIKKNLLAERTATLSALRESEERFRSAFDHAAIGMALVSLEGRWLQVNRSLCAILGYAEHELLVMDFQSITFPDDLDADLVFVRRLLDGHIPDYQLVKRYVHRQGHLVWVLLSVSLVRDVDGKPLNFLSQIQDISQRKLAEDALRTSENEFRAIFELAGVGKVHVDLTTGRFLRVNAKLCQMLGYSADELQCMTFAQVTHPNDTAVSNEVAARMMRGEVCERTMEKRYVCKDGSILWVSVNAAILKDSTGKAVGGVATILDITESKHAQWLEGDRRRVLEMIAKDLPLTEVLSQICGTMERQIEGAASALMVLQEGVVSVHGPGLPHDLRTALQHHALTTAAKLSAGVWGDPDACGVTFIESDDVWVELRPLAMRLGLRACWASVIKSTDGTQLGLVTTFIRQSRRPTPPEVHSLDMAAKLATICIDHDSTMRQLAHLVRHDRLTGLPNRLMMEDRLQHAISLAQRNGRGMALMVMDIDKFKSINDSLGHDAGDQLLQQFATRLRLPLRESDTMARLGGDEFVVVLPEIAGCHEASAVAQKLSDALLEPFNLGDHQVAVTSSIGIALFPGDGDSASTLLKKADVALYRVKERGRNGFSF